MQPHPEAAISAQLSPYNKLGPDSRKIQTKNLSQQQDYSLSNPLRFTKTITIPNKSRIILYRDERTNARYHRIKMLRYGLRNP
jgi:hypothetical protein